LPFAFGFAPVFAGAALGAAFVAGFGAAAGFFAMVFAPSNIVVDNIYRKPDSDSLTNIPTAFPQGIHSRDFFAFFQADFPAPEAFETAEPRSISRRPGPHRFRWRPPHACWRRCLERSDNYSTIYIFGGVPYRFSRRQAHFELRSCVWNT
jgi:hypothetical protein